MPNFAFTLNIVRKVEECLNFPTVQTATSNLDTQQCSKLVKITRASKKTHQAILHQKRPKGRHKARRKGDVENDIKKIDIVNWRQVAQDTDGCRR
jgi:hypothetical protein